MNTKGTIRDLLLVSGASLVTVFAMHYIGLKQSASSDSLSTQSETADLATGVENNMPVGDDSTNEQLTALRLEFAQAHAALDKRISELTNSMQEPPDDSYNVESLMDKYAKSNSLEDQLTVLEAAEDYNQQASEQLQDKIITQLSQLTLDSSHLNSVDCFASKCAMEFEHDSATGERVFVDHVLFNSKGLFEGKFSYSTKTGEDGKVYTKVISSR